jgi:hypothetical protein
MGSKHPAMRRRCVLFIMGMILNTNAALFVFCKRIQLLIGGFGSSPTLLSTAHITVFEPVDLNII